MTGKVNFRVHLIDTEESVDRRAKDGMFLSFQEPLEIPELPLGNFMRSAMEQMTGKHIRLWSFRKELEKAIALQDVSHMPARVECAVLGWHTMEEMLEK